MEILHELVATADVVQHNMRYDAAVRLGVDYESLRAIKPDLIYCHTRGFEHGARERLPGNDQTGAALAGPDWLDGGLDHDGIPLWPVISLGDTGNGFLSAIGMVQALYHRDRTGEGPVRRHVDHLRAAAQRVDRVEPGRRQPARRPSAASTPMQLGWHHATQRLYETADGWLCVAAVTDEQRSALASVLGVDKVGDGTAFGALGAGVPHPQRGAVVREPRRRRRARARCRRPDFVLDLFDDPEMIEKGWVTKYRHPIVGEMEQFGLLFDLPRRRASCRARRSCRARTRAPSCASSATTTPASTSSPKPRPSSTGAP